MSRQILMSRKNILLGVVPVIALTVFVHQLYHVAVFNLSRWKGGGMGMFSTIAAPGNRVIKAYFQVDAVRLPIAIPDSKEATAFRTEPTESNSAKLKARLSEMLWAITSVDASTQRPILQSISPEAREKGGHAIIHPDRIDLELWQFSYQRATRTVQLVKIRDDAR
jgi:hypothetical protein